MLIRSNCSFPQGRLGVCSFPSGRLTAPPIRPGRSRSCPSGHQTPAVPSLVKLQTVDPQPQRPQRSHGTESSSSRPSPRDAVLPVRGLEEALAFPGHVSVSLSLGNSSRVGLVRPNRSQAFGAGGKPDQTAPPVPSTEPRTWGQGPRLHREIPGLVTGAMGSLARCSSLALWPCPSCPFHSANQTKGGGRDQRGSRCPRGTHWKNKDLND